MATTIRLSRAGAKKNPFYRIVVTNSRSPRDSNFIEKLGSYNPLLAHDNPQRVILNQERIRHWLSVGAKPSERVHLFLHRAGILATKPAQRAARKPRKEAKAGEGAAPEAAAPAAQAQA